MLDDAGSGSAQGAKQVGIRGRHVHEPGGEAREVDLGGQRNPQLGQVLQQR